MTVSVRNISGHDLVVPQPVSLGGDGSTVTVVAGNTAGFPDAIGNSLLLQTSTWQPGGSATAVSLVVQPNGNSSITARISGSVSLFTDVGLGTPAVFPATITTNTTYYASVYGLQTLTVSLKDSLGYEHYLSGTAVLDPGNPTTTIAASAPPGGGGGAVASVAGKTGAVTLVKGDVGLGNVDNTADASKPVSTAQATADTAVQAAAVQRANHTGTQTASTISDFSTAAVTAGNSAFVGLGASAPASGLLPPQADQTMWVQDFSVSGAVTGAASSNLSDTDVLFGSKSASMTTDGAGTFANLSLTGMTFVDFTNRYVKLWVKVDDPTKLSSLKVILGTGGFANTYNGQIQLTSSGSTAGLQIIQAGVWTPITVQWGDFTAVSAPTRAQIDSLRIQVKDASTGAVTVKIAGIAYLPEPTQAFPAGVVTLCFDDGYASQYSTARPYLDKYGMVASFFPIVSLIDSGASWMTTANLKELQDKHGAEICGHAFTQADHDNRLTSLTTQQLQADFAGNRAWLQANGFRGTDISAWPGGIYNDTAKQTAHSYWSAFRGVMSNSHESFPPADPYIVRGYPCDNSTAGPTLANIQAAVDAAVANKSWLVLVLHDIQASPTANSIQWSTANFQALIDYIAAKGVPVRTFGDVLREKRTGAAERRNNPSTLGPKAHKLHAWTCNPRETNQVIQPATGIIYGQKMFFEESALVGSVWSWVTTGGGTLANCFEMLLDSAGNVIASSADQATAWLTTGAKQTAYTTPAVVKGGSYVYRAFVVNGTTAPIFLRSAGALNSLATNFNLAQADGLASWQSGSSITAVPASVTVGSATAQANLFFAALGP